MADHTIKKPSVFISHATSDAKFANAVQQEIEKVFANGIEVFCTSSPGSISLGTDWLAIIEKKLETTHAVIAIVTPISIERPWLWFEIGATWSKGRSGDCVIYPFCAPELDLSNLPPPLNRLQALSMGGSQDIRQLFEALKKQFGFGNIKALRTTNISKKIPKYTNVKVVDVDLNERTLYSGKYTGYQDDELEEVIASNLFLPDEIAYREFPSSVFRQEEEKLIHNGKLLHFREVDQSLDLPTGSAKRLLNTVAKRYSLSPVLERDNIVRYEYRSR